MAAKQEDQYYRALQILFGGSHIDFWPNRKGHQFQVKVNVLQKAKFSIDDLGESQKVRVWEGRGEYIFYGKPADIILHFMRAKIRTVIGEPIVLSFDKGQNMQLKVKKEDLEKLRLPLDGLPDLFGITSMEEGENRILSGSPVGFANFFSS